MAWHKASDEELFERYMKGEKPSFKPQGPTEKIEFDPRSRYKRTGLFYGQQYNFEFVTREEWYAKKASVEVAFSGIPADIVLGFTDTEECHDVIACRELVLRLQEKHMKEGEVDIKHNFLIGGDGMVYEGRGWFLKPPPAPEWTKAVDCSLNIAYIAKKGQFPPLKMAKTAAEVIEYGKHYQCVQKHFGVHFDYFGPEDDMERWIIEHPNYRTDGEPLNFNKPESDDDDGDDDDG